MTQQDYSAGPFITIADAAQWANTSEDEVRSTIDTGRLSVLRLSKSLVRLREREVGEVFGLDIPGPRELEIHRQRQEHKPKPKVPRLRPDNWLYWFYDSDGLLLYIGITHTGVKRMEHHGAEKAWWPRVATIKVDHFPTRAEAEVAEREAIQEHLPIYNGTHSVRHEKGRLC